MANDENIGGVNISITGDFSDLDAQFQAAVQKAVSEGASLAQAIQSALRPPDTAGLKGAIDLVGEASIKTGIALDTLSRKVHEALESGTAKTTTDAITQAIIDLGSSAQTTGASMAPLADATASLGSNAGAADGQVKQLGDDTANAGKSAVDAQSGFEQLAQQVVALGVALKVTEALKEFGAAALSASDSITHAQIALTAITGSATAAQETIGKLEALGMSDGLSFPSLLTAGTRMQQLLPEGTDVAAVLAKIADGAAVMGTDINAAATKFDMLVSAGTASARNLTSLGLSMQSLSDALNTLNPDLDSTATNAKKAFAALDPGDRIKVLELALDGLAGTAQKVAEQTFGGQWQILVNQWDQLLIGAGQALMPVITDLTNFAKVDVLPFLKALVDDFNALPGPVKDVAVAIGIAVAAVVPMTAALAGGAIAINAISTAFGTVGPILSGLAAAFTTSTVATEANAAADMEAALAADALSAAESKLGSSTGLAGLAQEAGAASTALEGTATALTGVGTSEAIADAAFTGFGVSLGVVGVAVASLATGAVLAWSELEKGIAPLHALQDQFESFLTVQASSVTTNEQAAAAQDKLDKALDSGAISADAAKRVQEYLNDAIIKQGLALTDTTTSWNAMTKAQQMSIGTGITDYIHQLGVNVQGLGQNLSLAQATTEANSISMDHLRDAVDSANQKLINAVQAYNQVDAAVKAGKGDADQLAAAQENVAKAQDAVSAATRQLSQNLGDHTEKVRVLASATRDFVDISKTYVDEENTAALAEQAHMDKITALSGSVVHAQQLYQAMLDAYAAGTRTLGDVEKAAANLTKQIDALNKAVGDAPKVAFFNADMKQQLSDESAALQGVMSIISELPAPISAANKVMIDFGITNANTGASFKQLKADADTMIGELPALDQMFANGAISQGDYDKALGNLSKDLQQMAKVDLPSYVAELGKIAQTQIDAHQSNTIVMTDLAAYQAGIQKLASVDLPAAIAAEQNYIDLLVKRGAAEGVVLTAIGDRLQLEIKEAEQSGEDANQEVLALERVRLKQQELILQSHGWADEEVKGINDIISGFDQMGSVMADAIVNGKNLGDALVTSFKKIGQSILTDVINAALLPLKKELLGLISDLLPNLNTGLKVSGESAAALEEGFKKEGDAINAVVDADIASTAAKQTNTGATTVDTGAKTADTGATVADTDATVADTGATVIDTTATIEETVATIADTAAQIAFATAVTAVASIVGAIAGIVGDVLLITISHDTGKIEVNTRETFAQITNIWETLKSDFEQTYNRDGEMLDRLNHIMDSTAAIAAAGPGGSASGMSADAINKIAGDGDSTVTILANTYSLTQGILAAVQTSANDLNWIQTGSDNIFHELGVIADLLTSMYQVMLYGKSFSASSESAAASQRATQSMSLSAMATQGTIHTQALNSLVTQSITGNTIGRVVADNTGATADRTDAIYAPLEQQLQVEEQQLRDAGDAKAQTEALRAEMSTYSQLAMLAEHQGNTTLAQEYQQAASYIAARIEGLQNGFGTAMVSALEGTDMTLVNSSKGIEFSTLAGAQLISTTVAQGSMLVASSVSTAVATTAAASAQFAASLTSSLINVKGSLSSAGSTGLPLNSQGSVMPVATSGPSNGLPPIPITGHMGFATGGSVDTVTDATLHPGEVVLPAVQVAASATQMAAQAKQIADLQYEVSQANITLQQSLAAGDVKGSATAQGSVNDLQSQLDALTAAMQANTAATATSAAGADGTTSADATLQQIAMLNQQQLMAQNQLAIAQKTGNAQLIQASQDQLDQVNAKLALLQTQQAPVATASSQMADLMKQQADLQKTLIAAEQTGNTALVTMTQKQLGDIGTQLDQLKVAQVNAGTASTTPTAAESAMLSQSQGDQSGALASLQDQVAQGIAKIQTSASSSDPMAAMLAMQQANAQQALSVAQSGGNPQAIQAMQAQLDQINQKISVNSGGATSSGALGSLDSNGLFVPPSAADYQSASLAAEALNTTDMSAAPDLSGLSSSSGFMDTTGIIDAIKAETDTLHSDLMNLATSLGVSQKWGVSASKVKSFDSGGPVMEDQLAMVHAGEFVVPPDVTGMLRSMASAPRAGYGTDPGSGGGSSGNGGGGGVVVNAPITITGVTDGRQLATMLEQHLKRVLSRTGKYTK